MKNCPVCSVCEAAIKGQEYKVSSSTVCKPCNDEDYISAGDVAVILEINSTCVSRYALAKDYHKIPPRDALRGNLIPIWKKETITKFLNDKPYIDEHKVLLLSFYGISRKIISKLLGIHIFDMNQFCKKRKIRTQHKTAKIRIAREQRLDFGYERYKLANKLLNRLVMP